MTNFITVGDNYIRKDTIDTYTSYRTKEDVWDEDTNEIYEQSVWKVRILLNVDVSLNCVEVFNSKEEAEDWITKQYQVYKPIKLPPLRNPSSLKAMPPMTPLKTPGEVFNRSIKFNTLSKSKIASTFLPPIVKN